MTLTLSDGPNITPEDILALPRPGAVQPNPAGTLAYWPVSTFDFKAADGKGRTERALYLVDLAPGKHADRAASDDFTGTPDPRVLLPGLASLEAAWLDDRTIAFLRPAVPHGEVAAKSENGVRVDHPVDHCDDAFKKRRAAWAAMDGGEGTEVWAKDVGGGDEYLVGKLPVPISDLTIRHVPPSKHNADEAVLAFSAVVYPDGDIWNVKKHDEEQARKAAGSDIKVYDELFVRHWDEWSPTAGQRKQVHFVRLVRAQDEPAPATASVAVDSDSDESLEEFELVEKPSTPVEGAGSRWGIKHVEADEASAQSAQPKVYSPLAGTKLECPVGPFGGASDFSFSSTHLLFHAKDPHVNPAWHTRTQVCLVPLAPRTPADAKPRALTVGTQGACSSPVLSPDGKRAAWLEMREDGYEADRNRVMVYEIEMGARWGATEDWDRSPASIVWAPSGDKLFLEAEDEGHVKVFQLEVPVPSADSLKEKKPDPVALTTEHSASAVRPLADNALLLTWNSLTGPNQLSLVGIKPPAAPAPHPVVSIHPLASLTKGLRERKALSRGEEFYFAGEKGQNVHGWICFPPEAEKARLARKNGEEVDEGLKGKKWPVVSLFHGGPQSAWNDGWSTRWNPNAWTGHGYITVAINRTGSTGFGQAFCDAIKEDWGGAPFRDIVAGMQFVKDAYPEIDPERMGGCGASYGGYMANWVQGHNDQLGFKCLICHDGVFKTANTWFATEELYFPTREFGGNPWEVPEKYARWSPHNHIKRWKTPQLVIHGSKDYRLVESEGLSVFNTLQRLGVPSRLLIFPSENHWVLNPQNSKKWSEEVFRWLDEWCGEDKAGEAAPVGAKPESQSREGYAVEYSAGLFE
ncbi:Dipeptidyl-peptidase 5 [Rhodotorula kratochvilovae]